MPNEMKIGSNDVENGYIYKEMNNRSARNEQLLRQLFNLMESMDKSGISITQLTDIAKSLDGKADLEYVKNHVEDSDRHVSDIKALEWDNKYELPVDGVPEEDLNSDVRRKLNSLGNEEENEITGVLKYSTVIGNNMTSSFFIRHNLGSSNIYTSVIDNNTGEMVYPNVKVEDNNTVRVSFLRSPASGEFTVVVIG
jgi:hypothetical protein